MSHTHTVTHIGPSSAHTHTYTDAEVHAADGDHSNVGTVPSNNNPQQLTQTPPRDSTQHSHEVRHQHGNYVSHTHTVTHIGPSSAHTHTYTAAEVHAVDGDHSGVGERTSDPSEDNNPNNNPTTTGVGGDPALTVEESGTSTAVEDSGTPTVTSSPQPVGPVETSAPQVIQPSAPPLQRLRVTEYMVRDWGGIGGLPQWIELYNPNTEAVNLKGYTFQYATRRFANQPYKIHTLTLAETEDGFSIAGEGVAILATHRLHYVTAISGIEVAQVYNLNIENVLKRGWVLTDADGEEIQRIGRAAFSALTDPVAPPHQGKARVSHAVLPSEAPSEPYYYGHFNDVGSPGFYEAPAPAAPSAVRRKRVGTWASLKRTP